MSQAIHVSQAIREQLRLALLTEPDLIAAVSEGQLEPLADPPGCLRGRPVLAIPRPMDPETAELRRLEVLLRPVGDGLEVYAIRGLDLDALSQ